MILIWRVFGGRWVSDPHLTSFLTAVPEAVLATWSKTSMLWPGLSSHLLRGAALALLNYHGKWLVGKHHLHTLLSHAVEHYCLWIHFTLLALARVAGQAVISGCPLFVLSAVSHVDASGRALLYIQTYVCLCRERVCVSRAREWKSREERNK